MRTWISDENGHIAARLVLLVIVEDSFLSPNSASIFWRKEKNILAVLRLVNEYIPRDESVHVGHACTYDVR